MTSNSNDVNNNKSNNYNNYNDDEEDVITVGRLVEVASRTWPGINKPGGVARVTDITLTKDTKLILSVNVHYTVGSSKERNVPIEYVKLAPQYEIHTNNNDERSGVARKSLRDRNLLLGRCHRCGSLRTDCGSCDWAMEEQQQQQQNATNTNNTASTSKKKQQKQRNRKSHHLSNDSSSSSNENENENENENSSDGDDSDDDDVFLQELLKESQNRYRNHKRKHSKWKQQIAMMGLTTAARPRSTTSTKMNGTNDARNTNINSRGGGNDSDNEDRLSISSSSSSSSDVEDIQIEYEREYQRYLRDKSRKNLQFIALTSSSATATKGERTSDRRRPLLHHQRSVLESATSFPIAATGKSKKNSHRHQHHHQGKSKELPGRTSTTSTRSTEEDDNNLLVTPRKSKVGSGSASSRHKNQQFQDVSPVGVAESSSPESILPINNRDALDDDDDDNDTDQGLRYESDDEGVPTMMIDEEDDAAGQIITTGEYPEEMDREDENQNMLALSKFIQPEGQEAVDNLPEDMVDLTRNLPYHEIPTFFDTMVTQIEDEILPDFKIQLAEFQSELRSMRIEKHQFHGKLLSSTQEDGDEAVQESKNNDNIKAKRRQSILLLLEKCHDCWKQLRQRLIRNGTDQCRAAFRRMNNDALYRKHKRTLTKQQRKQFRQTILDVRSLRMDAIEEATETLVRKLRTAVDSCEQYKYDLHDDDYQQTNEEPTGPSSSSSSSSSEGEVEETKNWAPSNHSDRTTENSNNLEQLEPCERPLAPFDPHMHATRKKKNKKRSTAAATGAAKRRLSPSFKSTKTKRHKTSQSNLSAALSNFRCESRRKTQGSRWLTTNRRKAFDSSTTIRSSHSDNQSNQHISTTRNARTKGDNNREVWNEHDMHAEFEKNENADPTGGTNLHHGDDDPSPPTFNLFDDEYNAGDDDGQIVNATCSKKSRGRRCRQAPRSQMAFTLPSDHNTNNTDNLIDPRDRQQPIAQRMQAFLDANSGLDTFYDAEAIGESNNSSIHRRLARRRQGEIVRDISRSHSSAWNTKSSNYRGRNRANINTRRKKAGNGADGRSPTLSREDYDNDVVDGAPSAPINIDGLFHRLVDNTSVSLTTSSLPDASFIAPTSLSIDDIPTHLQQSYSHSSSHFQTTGLLSIFDMLRSSFEQGALTGSALLPKFIEHLRSHGRCTLQEMISLNCPTVVKAHVRLLAESVVVLQAQYQISTNTGETIVFQESHGLVLESLVSNPRPFYDWLILQLVDALYALLIPDAWGRLSVTLPAPQMLKILSPLRDALAKVVPLTEHVCACILTFLGCQKWRRGITEGHAFISSIDPQAWKSFWDTGNGPEKPADVRLEKLGKIFPKVEVDALWGLLAYFGAVKSNPAETTLPRWQVISRIFSCGVLAGDACRMCSKVWLPPSRAQIKACVKEIGYFNDLLTQGSLDALHTSDGIVTKLIRRSLELQGDEYFGNERARANCYPALSNEKAVKKIISRLWQASHPLFFLHEDGEDDPIVECISCDSFAIPRDVPAVERDHPRLKTLLLPSSSMLTGTLKLLCTWIRGIPDKKARQNRLAKSIQSLKKELLDLAKQAEAISTKADREEDPFAAAFSQTSQSRSIAGKAGERREVFFREAVAYLALVETLSRTSSTPPPSQPLLSRDATAQIWDIIADSRMKHRQVKMFETAIVRDDDKFDGDPVRLFVAAKVMGCAALVLMKISPWSLTVGNRITRLGLGTNSYPSEHEKKSLKFVLSCIFSCLDCLCDLPSVESHIMGYLYSIINLIFTNLTGLVITSGDSIQDRQDANDIACSVLLPILERCFKVHLGSSIGERQDGLSLRLLYCAIRGVHSFLAACALSQETSTAARSSQDGGHPANYGGVEARTATSTRNENSVTQEDSEDIWGSMDDDLFATIDLPGPSLFNDERLQTNNNTFRNSLWSCMTNALSRSKPSERYSIISSDKDLTMSIHGIHLFSLDVARVCDCLVSIVVAFPKNCHVQDLLNQLSNYIRGGQGDQKEGDKDDEQFESQVAQRLSEELCVLSAKFEVCRIFVQHHAESFLFNFIGRILDTERFESLPSRDLQRIRQLHGEEGLAQALALLELFNRGLSPERRGDDRISDVGAMRRLQSKTTTKLSIAWKFGQNLGLALKAAAPIENSVTKSMGFLGDVLLGDFNHDSASICLETEVIKCIRFLKQVISAVANQGSLNNSVFEKTSAFIVRTIIKHIRRILQSLKYYDKTCNSDEGVAKTDMTRTKISGLLATYTEIFVAVVSWMLRESRHEGSPKWNSFLNKIYDGFLFPILRRQKLDCTVSFEELVAMSKSVIEPRHRFEIPHVAGLPGCCYYISDLSNSVTRRSRQLLLAPFRNRSIQTTLLERVMNSEHIEEEFLSRIVGSSFARMHSPDSTSQFYDSPLQKDIDDEFWSKENEDSARPGGGATHELQRVRREFLQIFVAPYLSQKQVKIESKRKILRMLIPMFSTAAAANDEKAVRYLSDDIEALCSVAKSMRFSLIQCLSYPTMDTEFLSVFYICSLNLANAWVFKEGIGHQLSLISWIRVVMDQSTSDYIDNVSQEVLSAAFLWSFFHWLKSIGYFIITSEVHEAKKLESFRLKCITRNNSLCHRDEDVVTVLPGTVRSLLLECRNFESWDGLLSRLDHMKFPTAPKNDTTIVNNYSKKTNESGVSATSLKRWIPSASVKRSAKEFIAEVIAVS